MFNAASMVQTEQFPAFVGVSFKPDGSVEITKHEFSDHARCAAGSRVIARETLNSESPLLPVQEAFALMKLNGIFSPVSFSRGYGITVRDAKFPDKNPETYLNVGGKDSLDHAFVDVTAVKGKTLLPSAEVDSCNVLTGICMFGFQGYQATLEDGRKIPIADRKLIASLEQNIVSLDYDNALSVYEIEGMQRICKTLKILFQDAKAECSVNIHIPRIEYILYAMRALEKGILSMELFKQHVEVVNNRAALIEDYFRRQVQRALPTATITVASPLAAVEAVYINPILEGKIIVGKDKDTLAEPFKAVCQALTEDPHWNKLMSKDFASKSCKNRNLDDRWFELNYMSYTAALMQCADISRSPNGIAVQVDDHVERTIGDTAAKYVSDDSQYRFVGVYSHPAMLRLDQGASDASGWRPYRWPKILGEEARRALLEDRV